jgi:hypothetical protein
MKETNDGIFRVAHSCNVFDLMLHFWYQSWTHLGHGSKENVIRLLREALFVSVENATAFVTTIDPASKVAATHQIVQAKRSAADMDSSDLASAFVKRVCLMISQVKANDPNSSRYNILPVLTKAFVERTLKAQEEVHQDGKPTASDIGYHCTRKENMVNVRE